MQVIDAFWEQRNLGGNTVEVKIEPQDSFASFLQQDAALKENDYVVVKVPVNMPAFLFGLSQAGYVFVETSFEMVLKKADNMSLQNFFQKHADEFGVREIRSADEAESIFERIRAGIFTTDRIYIDPHFTARQAAERYVNWIKDIIPQSHFLEICVGDAPAGFVIFKEIDKRSVDSVLGCVYPEYADAAIGIFVNQKALSVIWAKGYQKSRTATSSNNYSAHIVDLSLGYRIKNIYYTYVYHRSDS